MTNATPTQGREIQDRYFEMLAEMDLTKHLGSLAATDKLAELCHIDREAYVLDVGCGVGFTPVYLAKHYGCRVVGVDLYASMVERATARAAREGLADRVEFRVADMQQLPFPDGLFDTVIAESVVAFVPDKGKGLGECIRVTKPGGTIGFTEATWLEQPPQEVLAYAARIFGPDFETYDVDGWRQLMEGIGLADVVAEVHAIDIGEEARGRMRRIGCRNMLYALGNLGRMSFRQPATRSLMKDVLSEPRNVIQSWGCGVYAGRKPG
jgi:ubiquinone/menaquinone biosynthesis C-methylase UbiE